MKRAVILFLLLRLLLPDCIFAQDKYDYIWPNGYSEGIDLNDSTLLLGGTLLNFHESPRKVSFFNIPLYLSSYTFLCDQAGNLLFYATGCKVINSRHELMENGDGLYGGDNLSNNCQSLAYVTLQGELALPAFPSRPDIYYILHVSTLQDDPPYYLSRDLQLTTVDMSAAQGLGRVVEKNRVLYHNFMADQIMAVRHANGRDWWVVVPKLRANTYYIWLFSPEGMQGPKEQNIGPEWTWRDWGGQATFSPDGSKYARCNYDNGLLIMDFDRCAGVFSNPLHLPATLLPANPGGPSGTGFSASSKYLYLSWLGTLYQFDIQAPGVLASRQEVGRALTYSLFQQRLAPDGKIYMSSSVGMNYLHVIHEPEKAGVDCRFEEIGLRLPARRSWNMPNLPWLRLYELPESLCDTLSPPDPPPGQILLAPNPSPDEIRITLPELYDENNPAQFRLYDALGRLVYHSRWERGARTLIADLSRLPAAMYFWEVHSGKERKGQGKLVLAR
jgi:hypothetical protein